MSHFYGKVGNDPNVVDLEGTKETGLISVVASPAGSVNTEFWYDEDLEEDWVKIDLVSWHIPGYTKELYYGPVSGRNLNKPKR